jgi:hypothetical protein
MTTKNDEGHQSIMSRARVAPSSSIATYVTSSSSYTFTGKWVVEFARAKVVTKSAKQRAKPSLSELNERMAREYDALLARARENCKKLTGKDTL